MKKALLAILFLSLYCATADAQFNAAIEGTVKDANGGSIAGATVKVQNQETSKIDQTTTNDSGLLVLRLHRGPGNGPAVGILDGAFDGRIELRIGCGAIQTQKQDGKKYFLHILTTPFTASIVDC